MTYIVGVRNRSEKFATILSDIMATHVSPNGASRHKDALKTGKLFDGCIYAISGEAQPAYAFLSKFKASIVSADSIPTNVEKLDVFLKSEPPKGDFELLFAIRNPIPDLYVYSAAKPCLRLSEDSVVTLGSGKPFLDARVFMAQNFIDFEMVSKCKEAGLPIAGAYPFFMSIFLCETLLGYESHFLERAGVGGVFNFIFQTEAFEARQYPLVIVVCGVAADDSFFYNTYRISFIAGYQIFENLKTSEWSAFASPFERPEHARLSDQALSSIRTEALELSRKDIIYRYCGFAVHGEKNRGFYSAHIPGKHTDPKIVEWDGTVDQKYLVRVERHIRKNSEVYPPPGVVKFSIDKENPPDRV